MHNRLIDSYTAMGATRRKWLAEQIDAAASGSHYSENALREARRLSFLKLIEHVAITRYLQGSQIAQDRWTLQEIAIHLRYLHELRQLPRPKGRSLQGSNAE